MTLRERALPVVPAVSFLDFMSTESSGGLPTGKSTSHLGSNDPRPAAMEKQACLQVGEECLPESQQLLRSGELSKLHKRIIVSAQERILLGLSQSAPCRAVAQQNHQTAMSAPHKGCLLRALT